MIYFRSWDGKNNLSSNIEQTKLENYFGPTAVVFNSYQNAISAVLEVLGTRSHLIPVVLSVTSSPATIAAVLRAGGDAILLDIRPQTLQMDPALVQEVLDELKAAVIILARPGGQAVDPDLLALTQELPTILDSRLTPDRALEKDCVATFNIFDFEEIIGTGALCIHKYSEQVKELKLIRNGILGLSANLNEALSKYCLNKLQEEAKLNRETLESTIVSNYITLLKEKCYVPFLESPRWPYFLVRVENANKAIAHLHSHDIQAVKPVFPLHLLSDVNRRWKEKPSYPIAENLFLNTIALPVHPGVLNKEEHIVNIMLEVQMGTDGPKEGR